MKLLSFFAATAASTTNHISFPGLGIDVKVNETAFRIPGTNISVAWYGIIIMLGIIVAFTYLYFMGKRSGLIMDDLLDIAIFTVIPGIIGARIYYVFFDWLKNPGNYKSFYDVISIWNGGIAIYGAIIFGALGCMLTLRRKKIRIPLFLDYLCPAVMIAQSIGRWGNFVNGEAYGSQTSSIFAMTIRSVTTVLSANGQYTDYESIVESVHPTFLYESVWNLIGFILLTILIFRKKYDGQVFFGYFAWYGAGRMVIEGLRQDSLYIGNTGIRVSQLLAFIFFMVAGFFFFFFLIKSKEKKLAQSLYLPCAKALEKSQKSDVAEALPESTENSLSSGCENADEGAKDNENENNTDKGETENDGKDN